MTQEDMIKHLSVDCPVYKTMSVLGKKWTLLVLKELSCGGVRKMRYNELKRVLTGISPNILSTRLKEMEAQKLVDRHVFAEESPMRVEYSLTEKGKATQKVIDALREWGLEWGYEDCKSAKSQCVLCRKSQTGLVR